MDERILHVEQIFSKKNYKYLRIIKNLRSKKCQVPFEHTDLKHTFSLMRSLSIRFLYFFSWFTILLCICLNGFISLSFSLPIFHIYLSISFLFISTRGYGLSLLGDCNPKWKMDYNISLNLPIIHIKLSAES